MVPEPRHSVHTMPALALSPAIWLFQSVLTRLVQCQQREKEKEEFGECTPSLCPTREVNVFLLYMPVKEKRMHMKPCRSLKQFCVGTNYQSVHYFHTNPK